MNKQYHLLISLLTTFSFVFSQNDYLLTDINPSSPTYGENLSPGYFQGQVTLHFFGHQNWGTCGARVGYLDDLYKDLLAANIDNVKIIAIGREEFSNSNANWTDGKNIPVLIDPSPHNTWSNWEAYQRALFFLDVSGEYVTDFSITPWDYGGDIDEDDLVYHQIRSIIDNTLNIHSHPENISLLNAYPNPFNPSTNVIFSISHGSYSTISIYDMSGRYLETLSKSYFSPGSYTLIWNAAEYASGIYFIKLDTDIHTLSQKLILAK